MPQVLPYIPTTMMQAAPVRKRRRSSETDRLRGETEPADKVCQHCISYINITTHV